MMSTWISSTADEYSSQWPVEITLDYFENFFFFVISRSFCPRDISYRLIIFFISRGVFQKFDRPRTEKIKIT